MTSSLGHFLDKYKFPQLGDTFHIKINNLVHYGIVVEKREQYKPYFGGNSVEHLVFLYNSDEETFIATFHDDYLRNDVSIFVYHKKNKEGRRKLRMARTTFPKTVLVEKVFKKSCNTKKLIQIRLGSPSIEAYTV